MDERQILQRHHHRQIVNQQRRRDVHVENYFQDESELVSVEVEKGEFLRFGE